MKKISPITKLISLILLIIMVVTTSRLIGFAIISIATIFFLFIFKFHTNSVYSTLFNSRYFILTIILMNLLFFDPQNSFAHFWIFTPSYNGLIQGLSIVFRLVIIIIFTSIIMTSIQPIEFMNTCIVLLKPLSFIGIPVNIISLIISITMRFIPILSEEIETIKKAQIARGAQFNASNYIKRAHVFLSLLIPVFVSAFKRADELSLAMEARGFNPKTKRNNRFMIKLNYLDYMILSICIIGVACAILF